MLTERADPFLMDLCEGEKMEYGDITVYAIIENREVVK